MRENTATTDQKTRNIQLTVRSRSSARKSVYATDQQTIAEEENLVIDWTDPSTKMPKASRR